MTMFRYFIITHYSCCRTQHDWKSQKLMRMVVWSLFLFQST